MKLSNLPEPIDIKRFIKQIRIGLDDSNKLEYDFLAVWYLNRLQKYLWNGWKKELKEMGINWQIFLRILKLHTIDAIEWAIRGTISWEEFLSRVSRSVVQYRVKKDGE